MSSAFSPDETWIEVDAQPYPLNDEELLASDALSFASSLSSSVKKYRFENGRRYHAYREGEYPFPNDDAEQDRLDMVHYIFRMVSRGRLYHAPLREPVGRILDLGTGTGIWAIDIADEMPQASVLGNDLSPIQPTCVPPNLEFVVDDIEAVWPYATTEVFDFIHQRNLVGSISDWDHLFAQAHRHLRPGGYYEIQEFRVDFQSQAAGGLPEDSSLARWQRQLRDASRRFGKPLNVVQTLADTLRRQGFVDVTEQIRKVPIGTWARDEALKRMGILMQDHAIESVEPLTMALFTRVLGWSEGDCRAVVKEVQAEFTTRPQLFVYMHFIYGRRA
ncbi:class I SAM-dependent methyltransferase [Aspergillus saccharolyticus JOP 1030-1]|uniref:S-adenosyl-L-methionine-dependent methyltransferase n=1 Tax=Aspergillus saccharolyticus JOP 1030-1 TaxID=1450539 RepID=A0A318Z343_9EURO|nr:S-adenosyl-L-methionine-dependent methyltransferase [Aspergillus saccharolyticus JOP 1030-1]PYH40707.1 S-adenosyl-L-methionine-dependent methyltransferase [Aspergillus saccharolyticus JOP 1030-1]